MNKKVYSIIATLIVCANAFSQSLVSTINGALANNHQSVYNPCDPNTNSLSFNGTSAYADLTPATGLLADSAITVEAWVKPALFATSSFANSIVNKDGWGGTAGEGGYALRCGGNGILSFLICGVTFAGVAASWKEAASPTSALPLNTWSHVAGTFDGTTVRCFVNGVQVGSLAFTGKIRNPTAYALKLGKCPETSQPRYFKGLIDEVRIWKRALSAAELTANMNIQINPATQNKLIGYWMLNNGTGTALTDESTNNNTGTVSVATWSVGVPFSNPIITPAVTITASQTNIVAGTPVTFTSTIANGGTAPIYVWQINGVTVVGESGVTFTTSTLANNDVVACTLTSNATCATTTTAVSNSIINTVVTTINTAPVANNNTGNTTVISSIVINVLTNDIDVDANIDATSVDLDPNTSGVQTTFVVNSGVFTVDGFGNVTCVPTPLSCASALICNYTVTDNAGATSNIATITINVTSYLNPIITQTNDTLFANLQANEVVSWSNSNGVIAGATGNYYVPTQTGNYFLQSQDSMGCAATSAPFNFIVTSLSNVKNELVKIYPNPTSNFVTVTNGLNKQLQITNLSGQILFTKTKANATEIIDLTSFAKGIYFVKVGNNVTKIIKD